MATPRTLACLVTVLIGLFAIVQAEAGPIFTVLGDGSLAQAQAAESAYLSSLGGLSVVTEHFEGVAAGTYSGDPGSFVTSVGTFGPVTPGNNSTGQACGTKCNDGLAILDAAMSPYSGRFAVEGTDGHWLDSNDYKAMSWTPSTFVTSVGFFVTDINDVNALFGVQSFQPFSHGLNNGQIFYITVTDSAGIGALQFLSDAGSVQNDGFGIDGFSAASPRTSRAGTPVPEPNSLFLLGAGVAGLAAWRRRFRA
jgi:PEP-CTERM motif